MVQKNLFIRFYQYQKERFPFLLHGILISVFSFSAIAYSRLCRSENSFISLQDYLLCCLNTIGIFFLVRVFDEFKDKEDDAKFRTYLPVPRGLISLKEIAFFGVMYFIIQISFLAYFRSELVFFLLLVIAFLSLMGKEFFIATWLKKRPFWYVVSHMFIIPLVDVFASSFDWKINNASPPKGLLLFFAVSFFNGLVLEVGRKMKTVKTEEPGVNSYTFLLGTKKAILLWCSLLFTTFILACCAWYFAKNTFSVYLFFLILFIVCLIPAVLFYFQQEKTKLAKMIEISSAVWTIGMYLLLGGIHMFIQL